MRRPELAYEILARIAAAVKIPVSVKIRKGWDDSSVNAVEMAELAEKAGMAAIAVHGRTREQFYAGTADWKVIKAVKDAVAIPVIGNGDIRSPQDAAKMLTEKGCDGIMIGRGAQGNPWLFHQIVYYLETGQLLPPPTMHERLALILRHLDMVIEHKGEYIGIREMRKHAAWYTKGLPHSAELRHCFNQAETKEGFLKVVEQLNQPSIV